MFSHIVDGNKTYIMARWYKMWFSILLDEHCRRCLFSLQEKECWSLQVILKMELKVPVRNELGNIKGSRGKMKRSISPASQASMFARWSSLREKTVQHCNHLFAEEKSFRFVYQAGFFYLPQWREVLMHIHQTWHSRSVERLLAMRGFPITLQQRTKKKRLLEVMLSLQHC